MRRALGLMVLGVGLVIVACSDDEPTAKYPSSDAFCAAKATEECKDVSQLCGVAAESCKTKRTDACKAQASVALGQGRTFSSPKAETCIAKTTEVYKDRVLVREKEEAFTEACERAFVGTKKLSERCGNRFECEGTLICDLEKGSVCANEVEKKRDEFCNNPGEICVDGLYCQDRGGVKACGDRKKVDEPCDATNPCLETLRCVNRCVPKNPIGGFCDTDDECDTGRCDRAQAPRKCVARLYPTETGTCRDFGGL